MRSSAPSKTSSIWVRGYLILFNLVVIAAWSSLAKNMLTALWGMKSLVNPKVILKDFAWDLVCVQACEILEPLNSLIGLVPSSMAASLMLWAGRMVACAFGALTLATAPKAPIDQVTSWSFIAMALAWAAADIIRFTYYLDQQAAGGSKLPSRVLKALRGNAFLVLFPFGMVAEMIQVNAARRVKLTGPLNGLCLFYLCAVCPVGFSYIFSVLLRQRQKLKIA